MNIPSLVIGLATGLFIGILACILYRNKKAKDDKEKIANAEEEALRIITQRNALPFITGTICAHHCMDKCTRTFYDLSLIHI